MKANTILSMLTGGGLFLLLTLTIACEASDSSTTATEDPEAALTEQVKRGEHLVASIGCNDCHSPKVMTDQGPVPDPERLLSGYPANQPLPEIDPADIAPGKWVLFNSDLTAAVGPWGVSFAANLTPDPTGTGFWKEENFIKAIREGKLKGIDGSRPLLPPMPWPSYRNLSDDDLKAIFAYLKTIKPVKNVVPAPIAPDKLASIPAVQQKNL